jgi:CheY-like chemotaxis protein
VSYILAVESDPRQAAALSRVVKDRVPGAQLTVVDSKDGALASIQKKAPDLILLTALFSPREEEELIAHLRTLEGAEHLQTLTIPLLAASDGDGKSRRGLFGFKKKTADDVPTQGCDPVLFADQIAGYLKTAAEMKANVEAAKIAAGRAARRAAETAAEMPAAPVAEPVVEPMYEPVEAPAEPMITPHAEPAVAYAAEPISTPEPEPVIAPAPEPAVAQPREQPLVGYSVNSLGELLSKEEAVESAPRPNSTPAAEPQIFGSVLFAKVKPKREIKPFTAAAPVQEDPPARGVPMVDELPVAADAPAIVTTPIEAPPRLEVPVAAPVEEVRAYTPAPLPELPVVDVPPPVVKEVAFQPSEPLVAFSIPEPPPPPEPARPLRLVQRLPPLATWARRLQDAEAIHVGNNGHSSNGNDEGPLGVLRIPPAIATITYPTGCRIRRVIAKSLG